MKEIKDIFLIEAYAEHEHITKALCLGAPFSLGSCKHLLIALLILFYSALKTRYPSKRANDKNIQVTPKWSLKISNSMFILSYTLFLKRRVK